LKDKITRICDSFLGQRFEIPQGGADPLIREITEKIREALKVM
jgi:hypothetical protein